MDLPNAIIRPLEGGPEVKSSCPGGDSKDVKCKSSGLRSLLSE